jgi:hypothetical protein
MRFPVHLTLRGPFWAFADRLHEMAAEVNLACGHARRVAVALQGPVFMEPDLCWLELQRDAPGFPPLFRLHMILEERLRSHVLRDDVPQEFKACGYRPHVTLGWSTHRKACCHEGAVERSLRLAGIVDRLIIASYPDEWPDHGAVRPAHCLPLL